MYVWDLISNAYKEQRNAGDYRASDFIYVAISPDIYKMIAQEIQQKSVYATTYQRSFDGRTIRMDLILHNSDIVVHWRPNVPEEVMDVSFE